MSIWFAILSQFSIIAYALVGGVLLAFSDFIMRSLNTANSPGGIEVMQVINREVIKWLFMTLFLGMAAISVVIIGYAYVNLEGPVAMLIMLAAGLYIVGVFGVTVVFNVPLNNQLDGMEFTSQAALDFWTKRYLPNWTFWNSLRTFASVLAASIYMFAMIWLVQI